MLRRVTISIVLGFVAGGCSLKTGAPVKPAAPQTQAADSQTRPTGEKIRQDMQTRDDLRLLNRLLMRHETLRAQIFSERFIGRVSEGDKAFAECMAELNRQLKDQDVEVGKGYLWAHKPPADDRDWAEAKENAKETHSKRYYYRGKTVFALLRIQLENPEVEDHVDVMCKGLSFFNIKDIGFGGSASPRSGDFILLGGRKGGIWEGGDSWPVFGDVDIESLRHTSMKHRIDLPKDGIALAGELLLRVVPKQELGGLRIHIVVEGGISLDNAVVHLGRMFVPWQGGYPVQADGTCAIDDIVAGPCNLYVSVPDLACSPRQKVEVRTGQITNVDVRAYARRRVVADWKYRRPSGQGEWHTGSSEVLTGRVPPEQPLNIDRSSLFLSEWDGTNANISAMDGAILPAWVTDYDSPQVRASTQEFRAAGRGAYSIAVGKVFAVHYGYANSGGEGEAMIRIRSIEPVVPLATQPR